MDSLVFSCQQLIAIDLGYSLKRDITLPLALDPKWLAILNSIWWGIANSHLSGSSLLRAK